MGVPCGSVCESCWCGDFGCEVEAGHDCLGAVCIGISCDLMVVVVEGVKG